MIGAPPHLKFDQGTTEKHSPELYRPAGYATGIDGLASCADRHVDFYHEQGYLAINDAFQPAEVQAALDGLLDLTGGQNKTLHELQFERQARDILPTLAAEDKQDVVRKINHCSKYDLRLKALIEHPQLLTVITRLLGAAPELLSDQALLKPPFIGREKPWHQDNSMFAHAADTLLVGVWIALDDVTPENGCMHVIPGTHQGGPVVHFNRRDLQICDSDVAIDHVIAVPLRAGGCLLFDGLLHHGTPANRSPRRRRALQCWYALPDIHRATSEERTAVWSSVGKDVTCS